MKLADIAEMDQYLAAARESGEHRKELEGIIGAAPEVVSPPEWWPDRWLMGCDHLGHPQPVLASLRYPEVLWCSKCALALLEVVMEQEGCDLCGCVDDGYYTVVYGIGPITIVGVACESCRK